MRVNKETWKYDEKEGEKGGKTQVIIIIKDIWITINEKEDREKENRKTRMMNVMDE